MKTKPILFSSPMVQAIMEGRKTQTRRIIKPPEMTGKGWKWEGTRPKAMYNSGGMEVWGHNVLPSDDFGLEMCAKNQKGDILWVRETFGVDFTIISEEGLKTEYCYRANETDNRPADGWKPSIFMPKEACRLFLKVTNVRVERLKKITGVDACKEGVESEYFPELDEHTGARRYKNYLHGGGFGLIHPEQSFQTLWQSINGKESWNENPFVWVYDFEITEKPENFLK